MNLRLITLLMLSAIPLGCRPKGPPAGAVLATAPASFASEKLGIALDYPPGWTPRTSTDSALVLVPLSASGDRSISLDVPDLPLHLPGMVQMGLVKNGYLNDLRKKTGALEVQEDAPFDVPSAQARLVRSAWQADGRSFSQTALLMIHADRVYILRGTSDAVGGADTRAALDAVVRSLRWLK